MHGEEAVVGVGGLEQVGPGGHQLQPHEGRGGPAHEEEERDRRHVERLERAYGAFQRSFALPPTVDNGGNLQSYACDVCGSTKDVLRAARSLVTRALTQGERHTYFPSG